MYGGVLHAYSDVTAGKVDIKDATSRNTIVFGTSADVDVCSAIGVVIA